MSDVDDREYDAMDYKKRAQVEAELRRRDVIEGRVPNFMRDGKVSLFFVFFQRSVFLVFAHFSSCFCCFCFLSGMFVMGQSWMRRRKGAHPRSAVVVQMMRAWTWTRLTSLL